MTIYQGSGVALVTPFVENTREIDWVAFEKLLDFHLDNQTDALIITGTTGEGSTLTDEEQINLIKFAVDHVDGRIPVIGGTGINDTRHSIRLSQQAENAGVNGLLIVTPYYNKASYRGMIEHFEAIADSVKTPIILYHVPGRTGCQLTVDQIVELAKHPNIVGLKDATGDLDFTRQVIQETPEDFAVYSGNDDLTHEIMVMGGQGTISVTANVMPREIHQLCQYHLDGQGMEAGRLNQELEAINRDLFIEVNPIPVKYLVHRLGWCANSYRLPLTPPSEESCRVLDAYLDQLSDRYQA
ncbi:4-hydroxy-tetrahydrodipicolinate synthase [Hutsoniella sourekii]|uniref:4-hydroxy-tetrahydrodipicolinate synthase n=1 Tax=Hutsoniella sourekii TaxID=87650 RepID=UPI000489ED0E|nr:4-hydroxy-tetrahydrodipicolinate synthase [Hutsoniella sourekii]